MPADHLVLFHGNCPDGMTAAWLMNRWLQGHLVETIHSISCLPCAYSTKMPDVLGKHVWIVDFCFEPDDLARLERDSASFVILDHHQTSKGWLEDAFGGKYDVSLADLADLPPPEPTLPRSLVCLDIQHSGAGLALEFTNFAEIDYPMVKFVEDRDLWRFSLPETADVFAAITSHPYSFTAWDELGRTPIGELVSTGRAVNRFRDQLIRQTLATSHLVTLGDLTIPVVAAPYAIGSDVAGELATAHPGRIGGYYVDYGQYVRWGLRSTDNGPDVAEIAEKYGGGGHKHASGFEIRK